MGEPAELVESPSGPLLPGDRAEDIEALEAAEQADEDVTAESVPIGYMAASGWVPGFPAGLDGVELPAVGEPADMRRSKKGEPVPPVDVPVVVHPDDEF